MFNDLVCTKEYIVRLYDVQLSIVHANYQLYHQI